ncbi:MAG: nucleotidyltransferase domain-containing protein [Candidatus Bathyarchaeota archaeon]|nr:nucleotidyltransferase domain-containing protein [Candidatus Bathyarchaeota archaeon]
MAERTEKHVDNLEVTYSNDHWIQLRRHRQKTQTLIETLEQRHLSAVVHGSTARGDTHNDSDIDIFLPDPASSFQVETALEQAGIQISNRYLIQATPTYAMKAYIELDPTTTISFPLMALRKVEREFYKFSGEINLTQLQADVRVCGVNKQLVLIEPTKAGHLQSSIIGREQQAAKTLGVSAQTVLDRVRALRRRDQVGRTGVFLKKELSVEETFEQVLHRLSCENPVVRRRVR